MHTFPEKSDGLNMVCRNIWLGNTYYNFCYSANILNIRSCGFDRTEYYIAWYMGNMFIKFSKQKANTFAKIINGYKGEFKTLTNIWERAFFASYWLQRQTQNLAKHLRWCHGKIVKNQKPFTVFAKSSILIVWQGSQYASELASKVKDIYQRMNIKGNR